MIDNAASPFMICMWRSVEYNTSTKMVNLLFDLMYRPLMSTTKRANLGFALMCMSLISTSTKRVNLLFALMSLMSTILAPRWLI